MKRREFLKSACAAAVAAALPLPELEIPELADLDPAALVDMDKIIAAFWNAHALVPSEIIVSAADARRMGALA